MINLSDFQNIIHHAVAGVVLVAPDGRFTYANPRWCEMLGYDHGELLKLTIGDVTHPDCLAKTREKISIMLAGGPDFVIEKRYLRKDGSVLWAVSSVNAIRDEHGLVRHILAVVSDITAQKQAEQRAYFLDQLTVRLAPLTDGREIMRRAADAIRRHLGAQCCFFIRGDLDSHRISVEGNAAPGCGDDFAGEHELPRCALGEFEELRDTGHLAVADVTHDSLTRDHARIYEAARIGAFAAEAIKREDGGPAVVLAATMEEPRLWRRSELALLQDVVARTWPLVERAEAMAALRASEANFRAIFELSGVGKSQADPTTGRFVRVNRKLCMMLGYSEEELLGMTMADVTHPADIEATKRAFRRLLDGETRECGWEKRLVTRGGRTIWVEVNVALMPDAPGRGPRTASVIQDITARKTAEQALAEDLEDFQRLQEISTRLISEGDNSEIVKQIVEAALAFGGAQLGTIQELDRESGHLRLLFWRGSAAVLGRRPVDPGTFQRISQERTSSCGLALRSGQRVVVENYETDHRVEPEEAALLLEYGLRSGLSTPLVSRSGRMVGMLSTHWTTPHAPPARTLRMLDVLARQAADLMEQMQAERALRESEERFRVLVETSSQVVWEADPGGRMIGQPLDGLPRSGWPAAVHPDERERAEREWRRVLAEGTNLDGEFRFRGTGGGWRWINVRAAPLRDRDGTIRKWVGMNIDIRERKQAEAELRAARDELEQRVAQRTAELRIRADQLAQLTSELSRTEQVERRRLAGLLHDHIQQLLVASKMSLDLASHPTPVEPPQQAVDRASSLLSEALEASRTLMIELCPPVLGDGLPSALEWLCFTWMRKKHGLAVSLEADPQADSPREEVRTTVFLAVRELLFNVVKHSGANEATVSLHLGDHDFLQARVADSGQGFDVNKARSRMVDGATGLGLFSLSERLSAIGGRLEIESEAGKGTSITVICPRVLRGQSER